MTITKTVNPRASFYIRAVATGTNSVANRQCGYYESSSNNQLKWPGTLVPPPVPQMWTIDPVTNYVTSGNLILGGSGPIFLLGLDLPLYLYGFTNATYIANPYSYVPLKCTWSGLSGDKLACAMDFSAVPNYNQVNNQYGTSNTTHFVSNSGPFLVYYTSNRIPTAEGFQAVYDISDCAGDLTVSFLRERSSFRY